MKKKKRINEAIYLMQLMNCDKMYLIENKENENVDTETVSSGLCRYLSEQGT